jgi:hypothetical protein
LNTAAWVKAKSGSATRPFGDAPAGPMSNQAEESSSVAQAKEARRGSGRTRTSERTGGRVSAATSNTKSSWSV